jgi:Ca2+-binding RTX toxin-like protein
MNAIQMSRRPLRTALIAACAALALPAAASATVTTQYSNGALQVELTNGDDAAISCSGGKVKVNTTVHGAATCSALTAIVVNGDGDSNAIDLSGVASPFSANLLSGDVAIHSGGGADDITGSFVPDEIWGGPGNDDINVGGGTSYATPDDQVLPGPGADTITGSASGDDEIIDGGGSFLVRNSTTSIGSGEIVTVASAEIDTFVGIELVTLNGSGGDDTFTATHFNLASLAVHAGEGHDTYEGPDVDGADTKYEFYGDGGPDEINGGDADEKLYGGAAGDLINGGGGDDTLEGQAGSGDLLTGGPGADSATVRNLAPQTIVQPSSILDGDGVDTLAQIELLVLSGVFEPAGVTVDASNWSHQVYGTLTGYDDVYTGASARDHVFGYDGNDKLYGRGGNDHLGGGLGADILDGAEGVDYVSGDAGNDDLRAVDGAADENLICGADSDVLAADPSDPQSLGCESITVTQPAGGGGETGGQPGESGGPSGSGDAPDTGGGQTPGGQTPGGQEPIGSGQTPLDTLAPALKLGKGKLSKKGVYAITLTCPAGEIACSGSAKLASARKVGKRKVSFGTGRFTAAGGKSVTLKIKLSKKNLKLLKARRKIVAQLTVTTRDAAGNTAAASARTTLKGTKR